MTVDQLNYPEDRDRRGYKSLAGTDDQLIEKRIVRKDGTALWVQVIQAMERNSEGRRTRCLGIFYDISARKENEAQVRLYQERLALAAQTSGFGIYDHDFARGFSVWSPEL